MIVTTYVPRESRRAEIVTMRLPSLREPIVTVAGRRWAPVAVPRLLTLTESAETSLDATVIEVEDGHLEVPVRQIVVVLVDVDRVLTDVVTVLGLLLPLPPFGAGSLTTGGSVSASALMDQVIVAGVASALPAASVARTAKTCVPTARLVKATGLAHAVQAAPSSRQSNVEAASEETKAKLASVDVPLVGPAVSVVSGAVVSGGARMVQLTLAGEPSTLPAGSVARTANACDPTPRLVYARGLVHDTHGAPSRLQVNDAPDSVAEKLKDASVDVVVDGIGDDSTVSGAVVSGAVTTVHVTAAGDASTLPAGSMARTEKVWAPSARPE